MMMLLFFFLATVAAANEYSVSALWDHYHCEDHFAEDRPVHTPETWRNLQQVYSELTGTVPSRTSGMQVHVAVQQMEEKGRGVVALENIPPGTVVWTNQNTARFATGELYRQFLNRIPEPLACDVLQWAYVAKDDDDTPYICADLDEGSYFNSYTHEQDENVRITSETLPYALVTKRTIHKGEELLCDYDEFAYTEGWDWFGMGEDDEEEEQEEEDYEEEEDYTWMAPREWKLFQVEAMLGRTNRRKQ